MINSVYGATAPLVQASRHSGLIRDFGVFACLLLVIALAMLPLFTFYGSGYLPGDTAQQYLPFKAVALEAFKSGEAPLWNPYLFSGAPLLADPQNSLLYPSQLLFLLFPLYIAFAVVQYLHVVILAFGTYRLLRLYCDRTPAIAGSLAFALSGPVFFRLNTGIYSMIQVLAWIPWIFLCLERFWMSRQPFWVVAGGIAIGLQVLVGSPTLSFYTMLAVGIYLVYRLIPMLLQRKWKLAATSVMWWSIMFLVGGMLSAAQLLPCLEFIARTSRALPDYAFVRQGSLPIVNIITSVLPDIFGSVTTQTAIQGNNWGDFNLYIGGFPVIVSVIYILLFRRRRDSRTDVYVLLAATFLALAFGANNPAYRLLFNYVPGFRQLADPGRMTILYAFFLSIVSGVGIQHLAHWLPSAPARTRVLFRWFAIAVSSLLVIALLVLTLGRSILSAIAEPLILARYGDVASEKLQELDMLYVTQTVTVFVFLCVVAAGGSLIYYRMRSRVSVRTFAMLSLLIILADVGIFALRLTGTMLANDTVHPPTYLTAFRDEPNTYRILPLNTLVLINHGSRFSIPAITGYNPLILSSYMQMLGLVRGTPVDPADRVPTVETYDSPLLQLLNVKYLVSQKPLQDPDLEFVQSGTIFHKGNVSDVYVYKVDQPGPRAFIVYRAEYFDDAEQVVARMAEPSFDPRQSVVLEGHSSKTVQLTEPTGTTPERNVSILGSTLNSITLDADTSAPGWLVVSEIYYAGWKAYVDGQETPISRADLALRAVQLDTGHYTVEFVYDPASVRYGLLITFSGVLLVVSMLLFFLIRRWCRCRRVGP